jgi:Dolichyl-phosphate-mannose-protein mannosyltransferase
MTNGVRRAILVIVGLSLLLALALLFDWIPFLRGGFGWQWQYQPAPFVRALPLIVIAVIYLGGAWVLLRRENNRLLILWALVGAIAIPLAVIAVRADDVLYTLFTRTASGIATGPHQAGATIDWSNWLDWPDVMHSFEGISVHVALAPPGLPLVYHVLNGIFDVFPVVADSLHRALLPYQCANYSLLAYTSAEWASAWFGVLMPVWGALAVWPLFFVARRLSDSQSARFAVTWWSLVPALVMFVPTWNTFYPLIGLVAFWCLLRGLEKGAFWLILSGLLAGLLTFANFSLVPLLGLFAFYAILDWWQSRAQHAVPLQRLIVIGVWFALGLILPWLGYGLASGFTPLDLLQLAMSEHLSLDRPYLPWLWLHFWEWALFTGLPLIVLWLLNAIKGKRDFLGLSLLLTMIILILSGTARGETGRVWLFFSPFVLIVAAFTLQNRRSSWLAISGAQAVLMIVLAIVLPVIDAPDMTPPPNSPTFVSASRPATANFDENFRLENWDAESDGDAIILRLNWQPLRQMTTPYWFSALLVSPAGAPAGEALVWQPLETRYPTTCWQANAIVSDSVRLPLPADAPTGDWWISLSAFGDVDHPEQRVPVTFSDGSTDTQIGLGPVNVP